MKKISLVVYALFFVSLIQSTSTPAPAHNYARDNKYTVTFFYTDALAYAQQKNLVHIFNNVAHDKRYAQAGLRFRAHYLDHARLVPAQQLYNLNSGSTVMIFRDKQPYENARMTGTFTQARLVDFIEQWIGDYTTALLAARKESERAATAVAYASYPSYPYYGVYGYPYYGYGWGPYGYGGWGVGYNMGIWF